MKKFIQKILLFCLVLLPIFVGYTNAANGQAPSYYKNFSRYLTNCSEGENGEMVCVYTVSGVTSDKSLMDNIRCLFYPNSNVVTECSSSVRGGSLWGVMRYIGYALVVLFVILSGTQLLFSGGNSEKIKPAMMSLLYIIIGSLLFFGCVWILGTVINVEHVSGTEGLADTIHGDEKSLLFFVLSFMKALAFIAAILMMVVHGFKIMSTADKSDKVKAGLKGLLNVIIALVIIKVIDYVYYIAQLSDLVTKATDFIIEIARIVGFFIGALMVIMLLYAGFLSITDQGNTKNMEKVKNIIIGIVVSAIVIFALLLIIYEIFNEFA